MTHFEAYRWEDHVPRAGSWRFNLAAGVLALGLIGAALPEAPAGATAALSTSGTAHNQEMETSNTPLPAVQPVKSWWAYCPAATADYADS
jgi:hypothetical protein